MSRATDTDTPPNGIARQPRYCVQIRPQFYCYRDRVAGGGGRRNGGFVLAASTRRVKWNKMRGPALEGCATLIIRAFGNGGPSINLQRGNIYRLC